MKSPGTSWDFEVCKIQDPTKVRNTSLIIGLIK
jgi:hypothetical protein